MKNFTNKEKEKEEYEQVKGRGEGTAADDRKTKRAGEVKREGVREKGARIAIFDYGAGNLFSLKSALERNGAKKVDILYDLKNLDRYDGLVLPGVGNFDPAMRSIEKDAKNLDAAIEGGMPVMGICLGMEMLFNRSEEGKKEGLKILDGDVVMLPKGKLKVPHMGWNNLKIKAKKSSRSSNDGNGNSSGSRFLNGIKDGAWVYFVHSYKTSPKDKKYVVASSDYGTTVPAVIEKGNLVAVQFHPEKSGDVGAQMIKNFLSMCEEESSHPPKAKEGSKKKMKKERKKAR